MIVHGPCSQENELRIELDKEKDAQLKVVVSENCLIDFVEHLAYV